MRNIIVLTKKSDMGGELTTIARNLDRNLRLWQVYEQMQLLGNWDIIIPHNQDNPSYVPPKEEDDKVASNN